jgi:hypothetical protein
MLILAKPLVNSEGIWQTIIQHISYRHFDLERHDIILADGFPGQTRFGVRNEVVFHGGSAAISHLRWPARFGEMAGCAPVV